MLERASCSSANGRHSLVFKGKLSLYIRFLLTEETPAQWNDWEDLIVSLGSEFGFKIMGPDHCLLPCVDYFTLLTNNENFRMLQSHYNWKVDRAT